MSGGGGAGGGVASVGGAEASKTSVRNCVDYFHILFDRLVLVIWSSNIIFKLKFRNLINIYVHV